MSEHYVAGPVGAEQGPFLTLTEEAWGSMIRELRAVFLGARDYAREREEPGRIVFVSSAAAVRAIAGATLEGVAGAFLTTAARVAAVELADRGITANVVVPALEPDPETIAAVTGFLLSDAARGVSGAVVAADGGFSITKEGTTSPLVDGAAP